MPWPFNRAKQRIEQLEATSELLTQLYIVRAAHQLNRESIRNTLPRMRKLLRAVETKGAQLDPQDATDLSDPVLSHLSLQQSLVNMMKGSLGVVKTDALPRSSLDLYEAFRGLLESYSRQADEQLTQWKSWRPPEPVPDLVLPTTAMHSTRESAARLLTRVARKAGTYVFFWERDMGFPAVNYIRGVMGNEPLSLDSYGSIFVVGMSAEDGSLRSDEGFTVFADDLSSGWSGFETNENYFYDLAGPVDTYGNELGELLVAIYKNRALHHLIRESRHDLLNEVDSATDGNEAFDLVLQHLIWQHSVSLLMKTHLDVIDDEPLSQSGRDLYWAYYDLAELYCEFANAQVEDWQVWEPPSTMPDLRSIDVGLLPAGPEAAEQLLETARANGEDFMAWELEFGFEGVNYARGVANLSPMSFEEYREIFEGLGRELADSDGLRYDVHRFFDK